MAVTYDCDNLVAHNNKIFAGKIAVFEMRRISRGDEDFKDD
jgi:hypothetical protein